MSKNPRKREAKKPKTAPAKKRYLCSICRRRRSKAMVKPAAAWCCETCKKPAVPVDLQAQAIANYKSQKKAKRTSQAHDLPTLAEAIRRDEVQSQLRHEELDQELHDMAVNDDAP